MGLAIVINDVDFSTLNLGKVTKKMIVSSINIIGDAIVNNNSNSSTYNIEYYPTDTSEIGVKWDIIYGNEYASINENGTLTVLPGANNNTVIIRAISNYNDSVLATFDIQVTHNVENLIIPDLYFPLENNFNEINNLVEVQNYGNIEFDAENGAYFRDNTRDVILFSSTETVYCVSMIFKSKSASTQSTRFLFYESPTTNAPTYHGMNIYISRNGDITATVSDGYGSGNKDTVIGNSSSILDGNTHGISILSSRNKGTYVYVDGIGIGHISSLYINTDHNNSYFMIGNNWRGVSNNGSRSATGYIKDVKIFTKEITEEQAKELSIIN